jgi:hypothetical protein
MKISKATKVIFENSTSIHDNYDEKLCLVGMLLSAVKDIHISQQLSS